MKNQGCSVSKLCNHLSLLIFLLSTAVSMATTWYVTGHFLDSDAASEMVLAQHWIQTGSALSQDWIYGSEFRILHQQLVFAPLMLVLEDWRMIRFLGTLMMQAGYIFSFGFLCRQAGVSRNGFFCCASLLLLPVSVAYGRVVLYHGHYMPNITISFLIVGLVLGAPKGFSWKDPKQLLRLGALALLSFGGSLAGVRQLMITHAPLLLAIVVRALMEDLHSAGNKKAAILSRKHLPLLLWAAAAACFAFVGLKVNTGYLSQRLTRFLDPDSHTLAFAGGEILGKLLYGYFHQFGFRIHVPMVSLPGILSLGGIFAGIYLVLAALDRVRRPRQDSDERQELLYSFFLYYAGIMLAVFLVTGGDQSYYYPLYFALCLPWAVPLAVVQLRERWEGLPLLHGKKLFSWAAVLVLIVSGLLNLGFFNGIGTQDQLYEGLGYAQTDKAEQLSGARDFLLEAGYDLGYAPYWDANVLTELTDGEIPMINLFVGDTEGILAFYDCLTSQYLREAPVKKPFLMISTGYCQMLENAPELSCCKLVYQDEYHRIYDILDVNALQQYLYS